MAADLFALDALAALLQQDVDTASATTCRLVVAGLILGETRRAALPDPMPLGLTSIGLRVAARLYVNPGELAQEAIAGYSSTYANADLTAGELRALRPYKVQGSMSAPLANRFGEVLVLPTGWLDLPTA